MSDLLHDVDDMMRQEKLARIWANYGNYIIGAVLAIILAVALNAAYQSWFQARSERDTAALMSAIAADDRSAMTALINKQLGKNSGAMAGILVAQQQIEAGDRVAASATLLTLRNDAKIASDFRDLATLLWVRLNATDRSHASTDLRAALKPVMHDDSRPFAFLAKIEDAAIMAHRDRDYKGAIAALTSIANNPGLPYTLSDRARAMINVYRVYMDHKQSEGAI